MLQQRAHQFVLLAGVVKRDDAVTVMVGNFPDVDLLAATEDGEEAHGVIAGIMEV